MKVISFIFSTKTALVLLFVLAVAMATATFVENDYGTSAARAWFYESWWFEVLLIWLSFNFILHLMQYQLLNKFSWPIGLFHLAFILILIGAGVTRYFSTEGIMHIREGQIVNQFFSQKKYLQIQEVAPNGKIFTQPIGLLAQGFEPFQKTIDFNNQQWEVAFDGYYPKAELNLTQGNQTYIEFSVALHQQEREDFILKKGESLHLGNQILNILENANGNIQIFKKDSIWKIKTKIPLQIMEMATQKMGVLHANEEQNLILRALYQWDGGAFVVKQIHENKTLGYKSTRTEKSNLPDMVHYTIKDSKGNFIAEHFVKMVSFQSEWQSFTYQNKKFRMTYGAVPIALPFQFQLNDFELERYAGSQSPSGYSSKVKVIDGSTSFPYKIFMNNVLDYKGFRFYQSSYDTDEKGTVLNVNQDRPGTYLTYLGYILLTVGMFLSFFSKAGRFVHLNKQLHKIQKSVVIVFLFFSGIMYSQHKTREIVVVPNDISDLYGRLIVQDMDGRMKPLNTLANEITRKLHGKSKVVLPGEKNQVRLNAEQFLLAIQLDPQGFMRLPIIKNDFEKIPKVFQIIKKLPNKYIAFQDLLNEKGEYQIQSLVEQANRLKPSERNESDNEILKLDERFNIFYGLISGDFLRIFPNRLDNNNTWFTSSQTKQGFDDEDAEFVSNITPIFLSAIEKGLQNNQFTEAHKALNYIHLYQKKAGEKVYPSDADITTELLYNQLNLGNHLFGIFWILGIVMLVVSIYKMFSTSTILNKIWLFGIVASWVGLLVFTFHLLLRWHIAKHPPWSDGFEMLVFVAWCVLLFGILFAKKSRFTVPMGLLFSGTLLFVGFLEWLNPEITNLMPVLHSYWLKIHVAVIVSGYAPLALSAVLALLSLLLILFKPKNVSQSWYNSLKELAIVNEMSLLIGLFLLTVGTFLGGVWANESWGRYWAWDPKETWALISIIIYAIIIHLRLIPAFKSLMLLNIVSLWGFSTIIMTSFGVNYYLTGLHSYAKGDPIPVPIWIYWVVGILLTITILSYLKAKKNRFFEGKL